MRPFKAKPEQKTEIISDFNAFWDERAYQEIERSAPELNELILGLVQTNHTPEQIKRLVLQRAPQRWPESRQVEQAARWIAYQESRRS